MGDDKSIHIQGPNFGTNITGDHNIVNQSAPNIIPKVLTNQTGLANDIDFVGRKEELQKVDELLNQNSMLLLLNGIGGIGKSTLASYYLNQHKDNFDYYGFVQVNEDIKLSLASAFATSLDLKSEKIDDLFAEIMNKLQNLEGKKLLIIDDVKEMDSQLSEMNTLMTLKNSGFHILFTSRETKEYIPQYFLDIMSVEDARELFLKHYPTDEMDKVDKILEYLDYHTLFIEITAKTLKQRKRTLSLDKMIDKFSNGEFSSIKKNKRESFNLFLSDLFSNDKILQDEENILFLKRLSVLPSIEISFEDLYNFLVCEDEERLEDFLIELVDNGWLIESKDAYKFHQILKEFIFDNYAPSFIEIETILDYFNSEIEGVEDIQKALKFRENIIYFESLSKILNSIKEKNENVAHFLNRFGFIYFYLDEYPKAKSLYIEALEIRKEILGENHPNTAISYDNLGGLYRLMGKYKKAEELHLKAMKIIKEVLGDNHISTATSYDNLAQLYRQMKEYNKAEFLYIKAIEITIEIVGEKHPYIATSFNNLAMLYTSMGKYNKAEKFYLEAIEITKEILGNNHPDIAITYTNLADLYDLRGEYQKVEFFYLKAININIDILGENHPKTILNYIALATFYYKVGDLKKAYALIQQTIRLHDKVLTENSIDLIVLKEFLKLIGNRL